MRKASSHVNENVEEEEEEEELMLLNVANLHRQQNVAITVV